MYVRTAPALDWTHGQADFLWKNYFRFREHLIPLIFWYFSTQSFCFLWNLNPFSGSSITSSPWSFANIFIRDFLPGIRPKNRSLSSIAGFTTPKRSLSLSLNSSFLSPSTLSLFSSLNQSFSSYFSECINQAKLKHWSIYSTPFTETF